MLKRNDISVKLPVIFFRVLWFICAKVKLVTEKSRLVEFKEDGNGDSGWFAQLGTLTIDTYDSFESQWFSFDSLYKLQNAVLQLTYDLILISKVIITQRRKYEVLGQVSFFSSHDPVMSVLWSSFPNYENPSSRNTIFIKYIALMSRQSFQEMFVLFNAIIVNKGDTGYEARQTSNEQTKIHYAWIT